MRSNYLQFNDKVFRPDILEEGVIDILGQGYINNLFPINKDLVIVCTTVGASLFNIHRQKILWEIVCPSHISTVNSEYTFIALSDGKIIYLWDLSTGKILHQFIESESIFHQLLFSPNCNLLASSSDRGIKWWDLDSYQEIHSIENTKKNCRYAIAFSSDSKLFACGSHYNNLSIWDIKSKTKINTSPYNTKYLCYITKSYTIDKIAFNSDNSSLITTAVVTCTMESPPDYWKEICFWNIASLESIKIFITKEHDLREIIAHLLLNPLLLNPHLKPFKNCNETLEIWDLDIDRELKNHGISGNYAAFVPNSNFVVSATNQGTVRLWHISSKSQGELINLSFIDNVPIKFGLFFLLKDFRAGILFLNQYRVKKYYYPSGYTTTITFSPDSNLLASGSHDGVIKLWGVVNTTTSKVLTGHTGEIDSLVFSPDSKLIVSSSSDQTIRFWDITSGETIYTIKALSDSRKWEEYSRYSKHTYNQNLQSYNSIQLDIILNPILKTHF